MNVTGVGGSASLPVPLPFPPPPAVAAPASGSRPDVGPGTPASGAPASGVPGSGASAGRPEAGEIRLPGGPQAEESSFPKERKEPPKPEPLPPLKGLTVAEFRSMIWLAAPPGLFGGGQEGGGVSAVASAVSPLRAADRYA